MLHKATRRAWLCMAVLLIERPAVGALIDASMVIGPGHPFGDETLTIVDGANPPTRVTLLDGAIVGDINGEPFIPIGLDVFGQSEVRMQGGGIGGVQHAVLLHDQSLFRLGAGTLGEGGIEALDASRVILDGGELTTVGVFARDSSRVQVNGGAFGLVRGFGSARMVMTGGRPTDIDLQENSVFVMRGGILGEAISTYGSSRAFINGGIISQLMVSRGDSVLRVRGGRLPGELEVFDNSTIHLYGTGLQFTFDPNAPQIQLISGQLADGTTLGEVRYQLHDQGQIVLHEVPEPASWALLAAAAVGVWLARRWR